MKTNLFDFNLPESCIAQYPVEPRDHAKMLVVNNEQLYDDYAYNLADYFKAGDVVVFNNTKVIPTRLFGYRPSGGKVEIMLHKTIYGTCWQAFAKPARKAPEGMVLTFNGDVSAKVTEKLEGGEVIIEFNLPLAEMMPWLEQYANLPLPPYIRGGIAEAEDSQRYQTIYAKEKGAVAAPTAGLHFTKELMQSLKDKGVICKEVTLHVGAGTFLPVKVDDIKNHKMHSEWGTVSTDTVNAIHKAKEQGNQIYAIGTTSLRLLETAFDEEQKQIMPWEGETDIFIYPGYEFKVIDKLLTNFHLPNSTLFMLVSAIVGLKNMQKAYAHAIKNDYRFYSYGDCCLLSVSPQGKEI
ncbi:MAG: tRNA preQ1(34) S-adenosylmethionine ribosyltransferase-isomerase QueA [Alphaproteobacteria bacterium]